MSYEVLTSPLAVMKIGTAVIGKMRNVRATETIRRGRVVGLGELTPSELPAIEWSGAFSCSQFSVKMNSGILNAIDRSMATVQGFVESLLFNEGIQIDLLMKKKAGVDPNTGQPIIELVTYASIKNAVLTSEGFEVADGQISGRDGQFEYLTPILYG